MRWEKGAALVAGLLASAALLAACGAAGQPSASTSGQQSAAELAEQWDAIQMLPQSLRDSGELRVGVALSNPPSAYYDKSTGALTGFDIELSEALGQVLGLGEITYVPVAFSRILSHLGTDYDLGAAFTAVTGPRMGMANFVTYAETGSAFAVKPQNPHGFQPSSPCGDKVAVQSDTVQQDQLDLLAAECLRAGKEQIEVVPRTDVEGVLQALSEDAAVAIYWDSLVLQYFSEQPGYRLMQVGETVEVGPIGLTISIEDPQLTVAVQAALQHLMDEGVIESIFARYGNPQGALKTATINSRSH